MIFKDYYKILNIDGPKHTMDEIKIAYRDQAKKYHPDVNVGNRTSEERFKEYLKASTQEQKEKFKEMFPDYFNPRPDIKPGQLIYVKSGSIWKMRFFSHWDDDKVACYMNQQKEGGVSSWQEYSITNPLEG